jgi:gamma-glutamyltranspeptidase/glutathione hydrolase
MMNTPGPRPARPIHLGFLASALVIAAAGQVRADEVRAGPSATATHGMVVTVSRPASEVGVDVLRKGGNAVDASVAVAFALAVTWPEAGNLGGGGFLLVYPGQGKEPAVIDYRETAPAAATRDMYVHGIGSQYRLIGVPGTVRGLELAHRRYGKLPWRDLVAPAVKLAEEGVPVNAALAGSLNSGLRKSEGFDEFRRVYGKDGGAGRWQAGDRLVQPDLARTLRKIADEGADAFYTGELARLMEEEMKRGGGLLTRADLAGYRAKERAPVHGTYRGFDVYSAPPPTSGGICLLEMLNIAETFDLRREDRWSARTNQVMIEAMRRAYCDRARYLGDSDFVSIPAHLTSKDYARKLAAGIDLTRATPSASLAPDVRLTEEGEHTTHFSIIDRDGMAVANTYTLEQSFGSKVVVRGAGFLLNNEMGDFNPRPGVTDRRGHIGTPPNLVAPGKRMLSSMCPVVVARDGRVAFVTGSPGGRTIINTVFCVLVNALEYDMPVRAAVDAPRFDQEWLPDRVEAEGALFAQHVPLVRELEKLGHDVRRLRGRQGDAHSIHVDLRTQTYEGAADGRRDGWAAGY